MIKLLYGSSLSYVQKQDLINVERYKRLFDVFGEFGVAVLSVLTEKFALSIRFTWSFVTRLWCGSLAWFLQWLSFFHVSLVFKFISEANHVQNWFNANITYWEFNAMFNVECSYGLSPHPECVYVWNEHNFN